jgi:hypothetical protein
MWAEAITRHSKRSGQRASGERMIGFHCVNGLVIDNHFPVPLSNNASISLMLALSSGIVK